MNDIPAKSRWSWAKLLSATVVLSLAGAAVGVDKESSTAPERLDARDLARHLIAKAGTSHGLCSLLGCRDGTLALEIVRGSQFFLHVQDPRQTMVAGAAKALDTDGLYGTRVLVERQPLNSLLFADNTVDLVLALLDRGATEQGTDASGDLASLSIQEIVRVLRPG